MTFTVGETVVYPNHGAAVIEDIETRTIKGEDREYLVLRIVAQQDLVVRVPACNLDLVGVRDVVDKEGLDRVFDVLRAAHVEEPTNWSRRYKANLEKLHSGDVMKVSEVVRDLWRRERDRGLSAGEKRMLAKARQILVSELALAEKTNEDKAEAIARRGARLLSSVRRRPRPLGRRSPGPRSRPGRRSRLAALRAAPRRGAGGLRGLGAGGVRVSTSSTPASPGTDIVEAGEDLVLHDALCPMTPPAFIAACLERARATGLTSWSGSARSPTPSRSSPTTGWGRPSTATTLVAITSPLVVPAAVLAELDAPTVTATSAAAVADLAAAGHRVETLAAPVRGPAGRVGRGRPPARRPHATPVTGPG